MARHTAGLPPHPPRGRRRHRYVLKAIALLLLATVSAVAQEAFVILRFVTAREGGPAAVGEVTAFDPTEPQVVAWARFAGVGQSRTVTFRWIDPHQSIHRVSPTRILTVGGETLWDEMPLRGTAASEHPGAWTVELVVDGRVLSTLKFSILARRGARPTDTFRHQTTVSTRGTQTQTGAGAYSQSTINSVDHLFEWTRTYESGRSIGVTTSLGQLWGTQDGLRGSGFLSYSTRSGFYLQLGGERTSALDGTLTPFQRLSTGAVFVDLRYTPIDRPSLSFSARRSSATDDLLPHLTDGVTTSWSAGSSYFGSRVSFTGTYTVVDADDRTASNVDNVSRTLVLTGMYFLSPETFVFVTHTALQQDFGATIAVPAFTQRLTTTSVRLNYQATPDLTLVAFFQDSGFDRTDGDLRTSTTQWGLEGAYRMGPIFTARALSQWQDQSTVALGTGSQSTQWLFRIAVDAVLNPTLTAGVAYSPLSTAGDITSTAEVWTLYVNYVPSSSFFFSGTYTFNRFLQQGVGADVGVVAISARYAPNETIEYQLTAQTSDVALPSMPTLNVSTMTYQLRAIIRF